MDRIINVISDDLYITFYINFPINSVSNKSKRACTILSTIVCKQSLNRKKTRQCINNRIEIDRDRSNKGILMSLKDAIVYISTGSK